MRNPLRVSFLVALAVAATVFAADKVTVADLVKDPAKYDAKIVTLTGKAMKFKQKTSKAGNPYYNFKLVGKTDDDVISVYGRGKLDKELENETMVEVTGRFVKEKKVGEVTFKNEVDVTKDSSDAKTKDFGVKVKAK